MHLFLNCLASFKDYEIFALQITYFGCFERHFEITIEPNDPLWISRFVQFKIYRVLGRIEVRFQVNHFNNLFYYFDLQ